MFINRGKWVADLGNPEEGIPHRLLSETGVQENLCATLGASSDSEASGAEIGEIPGSEASEAEVSENQVELEVPPVKFL